MINPKFVIADHIKAICFIVAEGIYPSGKGRGYVLRKLMRRLISSSLKLNIDTDNDKYFEDLVNAITGEYKGYYPNLIESRQTAIQLLISENVKYKKAIKTGQKEWEKYLNALALS